MSWTTPRSWVAGEVETSAVLNLHLRDNLNYLYLQSVTTKISGFSHNFGGSAIQPTTQVGSFLTGATYDVLAPETDILRIPIDATPDGLYVFEGVLAADAGGIAVLGIFDMGLSPNAPNLTIQNSSPSAAATGEFLRTGVFGASNSPGHQYGVKLYATVSSAWAWGIRFTRVG